MSKYYKMERNIEKKHIYIESFTAPDEYSFNYREGKHIAIGDVPSRLFYKNKTKQKIDFISGVHSFPIVSGRMKSLVESLNTDPVEFHPAQLVCEKNGEIDNDYFFMNVLSNVECLDREKSIYITYSGTDVISSVEKFVIMKDRVGNRNIFRLAEIPSILVVSERLYNLIKEQGLLGFDFLDIDDLTIL